MISIEVYRDAGDRPGDDINDALLGDSIPAAIARGRAELDSQAHAKLLTTLALAYRTDITVGALIAVSDPEQGADWRGHVASVSHGHQIDPPRSTTTLTVERLLDA